MHCLRGLSGASLIPSCDEHQEPVFRQHFGAEWCCGGDGGEEKEDSIFKGVLIRFPDRLNAREKTRNEDYPRYLAG